MHYPQYSLFEMHEDRPSTPLREFWAMPAGGLPALLAELHGLVGAATAEHCLAITDGVLHPRGEQVSFAVANRQTGRALHLILFTATAVRSQAAELRAEGNAGAEIAEAAALSL